jgi:hypothetical protein
MNLSLKTEAVHSFETMGLSCQFIIYTNNVQYIYIYMYIYMYIYIYFVSTPTRFDVCNFSKHLLLAKVTNLLRLLKLQLNKNSRLKCLCDFCCMIKFIKC